MRKFTIISLSAALSVLLGSMAFAGDRTTGSATLLDPNTQTYVGTFVQNCSFTVNKGGYVGVYLADSFQVEGRATLGISAKNGMAFVSTPRAPGEEGWVTEIGGQSKLACLPMGSKVLLLSMPLGPGGPIRVLGTGTVK
jgi:hypothetical protein